MMIYSAVDAEKALVGIGYYFGNDLLSIQNCSNTGTLTRIRNKSYNERFCDGSGKWWAFCEPISKTEYEMARDFWLGQALQHKTSEISFLVTEVEKTEGGILINGMPFEFIDNNYEVIE